MWRVEGVETRVIRREIRLLQVDINCSSTYTAGLKIACQDEREVRNLHTIHNLDKREEDNIISSKPSGCCKFITRICHSWVVNQLLK